MNINKIPKNSKWRKTSYLNLLKTINNYSHGQKLDIGCGRGEITLALNNTIGIDVKEYCEWNTNPTIFKKYDGTTIPFKKEFDTIIFNNSFEHITNKKTLINNIKKISPRARIIIVLPTTKYLTKRYLKIPLALTKKLFFGKGGGIHLYLVHEPNIFGWDFLKEFKYYCNWRKTINKYFVIQTELDFDYKKQKFYVCSFKQKKEVKK